MTALAQDRKTDKLGTIEVLYPVTLKYPVEANTSIFYGALVAINANGNAVPASSNPALKCVGKCDRQCLNLAVGGTVSPDGIANGTAGSIKVQILQGVFYFNINTDSTVTVASFGANVFASDDNTISLTDAGGTRPYVGWILDPSGDMAPSPLSNQVGVVIGVANPYAANPLLATSTATQFKARAVVTSLAAYAGTGTNTLTASANGAWAAQDGVTDVVGDVVFIPATTTNLTSAVDSGPWVITSLGGAGAKWTLVRPDWFSTGGNVVQGLDIGVGGEGTAWAGNTFRSFAAIGQIIGTNDPVFYPRMQVVTTGAMSAGVSTANSTLFIRPLAQLSPVPVTPGGTQGTLRMSTTTAGYPGTSSLVVTSSSNTDTSTVKIQVENF